MAKKPSVIEENNDAFMSFINSAEHYQEIDIPDTGFVDTGSYSLNALISGTIFGGVPRNRVTMFAGDPATGKTFFCESIGRRFQKLEKGGLIWYDTEYEKNKTAVAAKGLDASKLVLRQPLTLQEFTSDVLKFITTYEAIPVKKRPPLMLVLDSLGNLSTAKEREDAEIGNGTRDMTRAQLIRGSFRTITSRLGMANIPLIMTTHTYDSMSQYTPKELSGGGGGKYAASTIITLSKSAEKDKDKDVVGVLITAKTYKSRYTREKQTVEIRLSFEKGLDRYWGLIDLALDAGIWDKGSKGTIQLFPGSEDKAVNRRAIEDSPRSYFTPEILSKIDAYVGERFKFGAAYDEDEIDEEVTRIVEEITPDNE